MNTICAISTAHGVGGIAVIRVSGDDAFSISDKVFSSKISLAAAESHKAVFGTIRDEGKVLDEVLATPFKNPHSFTGEDTVEIACHGSLFIQQRILELLIQSGASMAQPGEFTQRSFMNGKMDLSQAEAVADLIASNSKAAHRLALKQMRGDFSDDLIKLRAELLNFVSLVELELDFGEEDVEFADRSQLRSLTDNIYAHIKQLTDSFSLGNAIKNGIPVTIVGETNVGKSTLLNALLKDDKAIVSDIHGTTRDSIEDVINLGGVAFRFIDTAGIRHTDDTIESMGIERSYKKMSEADIVLLVIDSSKDESVISNIINDISLRITDQKLLVLFNKADLLSDDEQGHVLSLSGRIPSVCISAKGNIGISELEDKLTEMSNISKAEENSVIVSNARHYEALMRAQQAIERVNEGLENQISGDFLAQDIRECMHHLSDITGQIATDDILGNIFKNFCIGK